MALSRISILRLSKKTSLSRYTQRKSQDKEKNDMCIVIYSHSPPTRFPCAKCPYLKLVLARYAVAIPEPKTQPQKHNLRSLLPFPPSFVLQTHPRHIYKSHPPFPHPLLPFPKTSKLVYKSSTRIPRKEKTTHPNLTTPSPRRTTLNIIPQPNTLPNPLPPLLPPPLPYPLLHPTEPNIPDLVFLQAG
jgi:hypothetical protein